MMKHLIHNRKIAISEDEKIVGYINKTIEMFNSLKIEYAIVGSAGIQTYFDYFYRLPNDLDIIVRKKDIHKITALCKEKGYKIIEQLGKLTIQSHDLPIDIIPEEFSITDESKNSILASVDLSNFLSTPLDLSVKLLNAKSSPIIKVLPIELILYLELIRTIYTESLINIYFIFRYLEIDNFKFKSIMQENTIFSEIIMKRLTEYSTKIKFLTYYSKDDIQLAKKQIEKLMKGLN